MSSERCYRPCCGRATYSYPQACSLPNLPPHTRTPHAALQAVLQSCNLRMKHYFKSHPELVVIDDPDDPKLK